MSKAEYEEKRRVAVVNGLRELADLVESGRYKFYGNINVFHVVSTAPEFREASRKLGGFRKKERLYSGALAVFRDLGGGVKAYVSTAEEVVCKPKVIGTRTVQKPDPDADVPMVEVTEDVVEYVCESFLKAPAPVEPLPLSEVEIQRELALDDIPF